MEEKVKQKELLKGLVGKGVVLNTRSLAKFTAENGILVSVRVGRIRGRFNLPTKMLGLRVDKWGEEVNFFSEHVKMGAITLIPKELDAKLNALDTKVRRLLQNNSTNGSYMPLAVYDEFLEEFEAIRAEYLKTVEDIALVWEDIRDQFISGATALIEARGKRQILKRDRDAMLRTLVNSIPSANTYRNSAYMELEVRAFPTTGVTSEGLAPDLQDRLNQVWMNDVVSNALKSIQTCIGQIFAQACRTAEVYAKTEKMDSRSVGALARVAARVKTLNAFCNPILDSLGSRLSAIDGLTDDAIEELVEESILDTVEYAKKTGIKLDMSVCPFTDDQLGIMLELRERNAAHSI